MTGQALTGALATGMVGAVGVAASKIYDAATKSRDFRAMLSVNPELHDFVKENPNKANSLFTSLRQINPDFSKDPYVAGHYIRQMAGDPGREGGYLLLAAQERGRFEQPILESYLKGGVEGAKPRSSNTLPWGTPPGGPGGPPPNPRNPRNPPTVT